MNAAEGLRLADERITELEEVKRSLIRELAEANRRLAALDEVTEPGDRIVVVRDLPPS